MKAISLALILLSLTLLRADDSPPSVTLHGTVIRHIASGYFVDVAPDPDQAPDPHLLPKGLYFLKFDGVLVTDQAIDRRVYPAGIVQTPNGNFFKAYTQDAAAAVVDPDAKPVKL